jgi:DNA-binding transcriptional MocR family regulator
MTGWRLGWLVVPDALVPVIEQLAQHLFICASTVSQHAALACFEPEPGRVRAPPPEFKARRDYFMPQLNALGLTVPVTPDGAFYAWADCSAACDKLFAGRSEYIAACKRRAAGIRLRADEARAPGRHAGARLRPCRPGTLRALFHRQLDGPAADRHRAPETGLA